MPVLRLGNLYIPTVDECAKCKYQNKCYDGRLCVKDNTSVTAPPRNGKRTYQYTKEGKLVGVYESSTEAQNSTGVSKQSIGSCARGKTKYAGGYQWKYH